MGISLKHMSLGVLAALALSGCETTEGYRQHRDLDVGKISDQVLVEWGAPVTKETLSDGSELWVYRRLTESKTGGYWSERQRSRTEVVTVDGKQVKRTVTFKEPYYEPEVVTRHHCETRFVIGTDHHVRSVSFEGDGCVAEEIETKPAASGN